MMAIALSLLAASAMASLCYFTSRSFSGITNYADMAMMSRMAMDKMSRDIRSNYKVTAFTTNSITLQDSSTNLTRYTWDSSAQTLSRVRNGTTSTYLTQCNSLQFWIYQHTTQSNTLDCYVSAVATNARVVQVTWTCFRKIRGASANTEAVESSKIILRNY